MRVASYDIAIAAGGLVAGFLFAHAIAALDTWQRKRAERVVLERGVAEMRKAPRAVRRRMARFYAVMQGRAMGLDRREYRHLDKTAPFLERKSS